MRALLSLILAGFPLTAYPQVELPRSSATVEVRVMELDAVVTDWQGRPVHGLTVDDFELLENGRRREITGLTEFRDDSGTGDPVTPQDADEDDVAYGPKPRQIVIFFDTLSTSPPARKRAADALVPLIESLNESDELMIVSWNRSLRIVVPPTSDRARIMEGLKIVPLWVSGAPEDTSFGILTDNIGSVSSGISADDDRALKFSQANDSIQTTQVLRALISRLAGASGKKLLFVISDGLGLDNDLASDLNHVRRETRSSAFDTSADAGRGMVEEIVQDANAADVTIHTVQPIGLITGASAADSGVGGAELFATRRFARVQAGASTLIRLAEQTGGRFITKTNNLAPGMERIRTELANYYSIAYRPAENVADKARKVELRTKRRDLRVRTRRAVLERSPETQFAQQLVSNFMFPVSSNDLKISLRPVTTARLGRRRFAIPVDVVIPYSTLAFVSEGERYVAEISVYVASSDDRGSISEVRRFDRQITVPKDEFSKLAAKQYVYGLDLDLRSRSARNRLTVGVIDQLSKLSGSAVLDAPAPEKTSAKR